MIMTETIEEAAERFVNNTRLKNPKSIFCEGAKWQQERSYSGDDMRKAFIAGFTPKITTTLNDSFNKWFEQLKKK